MLAKRVNATNTAHVVIHLKEVDPTIKFFNAIFVVGGCNACMYELVHISLRDFPKKYTQIKPTDTNIQICVCWIELLKFSR